MSEPLLKTGVLAFETYVPRLYVEQSDLELYDQANDSSATGIRWVGKYTKGLCQEKMAVVSDREDACSMALTVVSRLLKNWNVSHQSIGKICVASETVSDHSKSIKSVLMQLFGEHSDVEGCDLLHACYSGTEALFSCFDWVDSPRKTPPSSSSSTASAPSATATVTSATSEAASGATASALASEVSSKSSADECIGQLALIVCVDVAEYNAVSTRPTAGAGAVALLIGRSAQPLLTLANVRASHSEHAYDFFKPFVASPYPVVDGPASNRDFLNSIDKCYDAFAKKFKAAYGHDFRTDDIDYWAFHAPYNKLVKKSFARLVFNDFYRHSEMDSKSGTGKFADAMKDAKIRKLCSIKPASVESHTRELMSAFVKLSGEEYTERVAPSAVAPIQIGNCYTASLWMGLASLIASVSDASQLCAKKVGCFSYGSGICSTLFVLQLSDSQTAIKEYRRKLRPQMRGIVLAVDRAKVSVEHFMQIKRMREEMYAATANPGTGGYQPRCPPQCVATDAFYLERTDELGHRFYERTQTERRPKVDIGTALENVFAKSRKAQSESSSQSDGRTQVEHGEKSVDACEKQSQSDFMKGVYLFSALSVAMFAGYKLGKRRSQR